MEATPTTSSSGTKGGGFFRFFEALPPAARGLLVVGGVGAAAFAIVKIAKAIKDKKNAEAQYAPINQAVGDLQILRQNGIRPSYIQSTYAEMANTLAYAMGGCNVNYDTIYSVFEQLKNTADLQSLVLAFGVRKINGCWINPLNFEYGLWNRITGTEPVLSLPATINAGMQSGWNDDMLDKINQILANKGINYKF